MTNDKRVEEIRERLAKATPGPWRKGDSPTKYTSGYNISGENEWPVFAADGKLVAVSAKPIEGEVKRPIKANADLLANAPSDLAFLLSELDRARKVVEAARNPCGCAASDHYGPCRLEDALDNYDAPTENKSK